MVAPHRGAWIETPGLGVTLTFPASPLTEGRGLKHHAVARPR